MRIVHKKNAIQKEYVQIKVIIVETIYIKEIFVLKLVILQMNFVKNAIELENVYLDLDDDYRPSLLNADAIISDRSAVMIEAATVGVPVLYMSNADYYEPMTAAVLPLVESYEQGQTCADMVAFVKRCRQGLDLNRDARNAICPGYWPIV